ncbi:MAG: LytTR family DNA-binding domain-containing protein [Flavobacteriales bacterium]
MDDILYCKSDDDITEIHLCQRPRLVVSRSLKEFEACLGGKGFLRVHQSYLVNLGHVVRYARHMLVLSNGQEVPVSRNRRNALAEAWEHI